MLLPVASLFAVAGLSLLAFVIRACLTVPTYAIACAASAKRG